MGHSIQAFIGSEETLKTVRHKLGASKVVPLAQGRFLLPATEELLDAVPLGGDQVAGFIYLDMSLLEFLKQISQGTEIGYFETEYFGGVGDQGAVLAKDGAIVVGPQRGSESINAILKALGVKKEDSIDEFAAVGLHRYRNNDDWLSKAQQ